MKTIFTIIMLFLSMALYASTEVFEFASQAPIQPGLYDSPTTSSCGRTANNIAIGIVTPDDANNNPGLIINLPGLSNFDCNPSAIAKENWANDKNVIIATIAYRNLSFLFPTDFGKISIVDVLRGLSATLQRYPQINTNRIYLYGESGGGHLALQVYQVAPEIWAEVYVHSAITLISTQADVSRGYITRWNGNLGFPESQGSLTQEQWDRYQAEREIRSPQFLVGAGANITCPVWMFHGTADPLVPIINMNEYKQHITLPNWHFVDIVGGNHGYAGAANDEDTRTEATVKYVPDCFTRTQTPNFSVNYVSPTAHGWCMRITGPISSVELTMDQDLPTLRTGWLTSSLSGFGPNPDNVGILSHI